MASVDAPKDATVQDSAVLLDIAFGMDCTGSMGSYIDSARQNMRSIVETIVSAESADVRLALVEYRDHPPQESTFVTRVHDFTPSIRTMRGWLDACHASGGGDGPEAVADGLHQVLKLSWRDAATKICVFISDAPPHGLASTGDGFPNGCPDGLDTMQVTNQLAEKGVVLYTVGCEPSINPYKDFFMALAHLTGGQYVPLRHANLLTKVIVGGAQEELSLDKLMAQVDAEVQAAVKSSGDRKLSREALSETIYNKLKSSGHRTVSLTCGLNPLPRPSLSSRKYSQLSSMDAVKSQYVSDPVQPQADPVVGADFASVEDEVTSDQVERLVTRAVYKGRLHDRVKSDPEYMLDIWNV